MSCTVYHLCVFFYEIFGNSEVLDDLVLYPLFMHLTRKNLLCYMTRGLNCLILTTNKVCILSLLCLLISRSSNSRLYADFLLLLLKRH